MAGRSSFIDDDVAAYIVQTLGAEPPVLAALRAETSTMRGSGMQIDPDQGAFMRLVVETLGVQRAIEVGVYTGYSSICVASAMGSGGRLVACDVREEWTNVARRYWEEAGLQDRIELHLRPALDTLAQLQSAGAEPFDFAFIDADKENYDAYYEACLALLRPGGLLMVDNALWGGSVADAQKQDVDTVAIRALNEKVCADPRVTASLIPVGDGLLLARKRP